MTIPFHRCKGAVEFPPPVDLRIDFETVWLRPQDSPPFGDNPSQKLSVTVEGTRTEVHFDGPGNALLTARVAAPTSFQAPAAEAHASVSLLPVGAERPVVIGAKLLQAEAQGTDALAVWQLGKHPRAWRADSLWA